MIDSCPDFWSFPFECRFETEDSRIATLEKFADEAAPGAWQSQYANSTEISFRFSYRSATRDIHSVSSLQDRMMSCLIHWG
jgi:hypothetical protein